MARGSPACSPGFCAGVWSLRCVEETGRPASDSGPQAFAGGGCPLCNVSLLCQDPLPVAGDANARDARAGLTAVTAESSPERRCSSRTFRYGYLVTT